MKSIKLTIELIGYRPGDVIEMQENIAQQFIMKGWGEETAEPVKEKPKPAKGERQVISRKIPKK